MDATDEAAGREVRSHDDGGKKDAMPSAAARNAKLLLAAVVFIGWLLMWVVWPTRTNSLTWSPKLTAEAPTPTPPTLEQKVRTYCPASRELHELHTTVYHLVLGIVYL